ncbi:DUF3987 domain-containing protein [Candidatus Babeliales bacterium]|nr:DUF3987 domain-containing protein [Candidatus Babeliales bacterium]MBP9843500.1 DUF3987 domain-containing protein [Candidatus Babeliales bacterium]
MYLNNTNFQEQCRSYMIDKGLAFDGELMIDGKIHRYSFDNKPSKKDEWYIGHEIISSKGYSGLTVSFGSWSEGITYTYRSFDQQESFLSQENIIELKEIARRNKFDADQKVREEQNQAAVTAQKIWNSYSMQPLLEECSRYERHKQIRQYEGVRYGLHPKNKQAFMVIPLVNIQGQLRSLQYIYHDAQGFQKRFFKDAEKRGNFHVLGILTDSVLRIIFVEGYATGASVFEAMSEPVIVCFDAGNIIAVVEVFRQKYPQTIFIIAADGDDVGRSKAAMAASKYNCTVITPEFPLGFDLKKYTDFNDLHVTCGIEVVQQHLVQIKYDEPCSQKTIAESYFAKDKEPCDSFKIEALPPIFREYVVGLSKTTKAHPIMIASSVLAMVSGYLGTKVSIPKNEYFQTLYPNLWILCIAKSGQFKTTALNKGSFIARSQESKLLHQMKSMKDEGTDEQAILNISRQNIILPTKLTSEAFLEYLSSGHEGTVFSSEFGGWLSNLEKNHNSDFKPILTDFYDVPLSFRYKTRTQAECIIHQPFISICGVSTMAWISSNLKPTDISSGFFARFLIIMPPYQDEIPSALPEKTNDNMYDVEHGFQQKLMFILEKIADKKEYTLNQDAQKKFIEIHNAMYQQALQYDESAQEVLQPYLKRWSPAYLKIAMIMQLFIDADAHEIDNIAILMAHNFLKPAIESTKLLLQNELSESRFQSKCRKLFEWICSRIRKLNKPVTWQEILASKQLEHGGEEYETVLSMLIDQGLIEHRELKPKKNSEYFLAGKIEK